MTEERIDLAEPINEICSRLGVSPDWVKEIALRPLDAEITVFKAKDGNKYINEEGEAETVTLLFDIHA